MPSKLSAFVSRRCIENKEENRKPSPSTGDTTNAEHSKQGTTSAEDSAFHPLFGVASTTQKMKPSPHENTSNAGTYDGREHARLSSDFISIRGPNDDDNIDNDASEMDDDFSAITTKRGNFKKG